MDGIMWEADSVGRLSCRRAGESGFARASLTQEMFDLPEC